jgi:hypothetical protein
MYKEEPQPFLEEIIVKKLLLQEAKEKNISPRLKPIRIRKRMLYPRRNF